MALLKEWEKLCKEFNLLGPKQFEDQGSDSESVEPEDIEKEDSESDSDDGSIPDEEFEVQELLAVCHGDPNNAKEPGLYFKVLRFKFTELNDHYLFRFPLVGYEYGECSHVNSLWQCFLQY